MAGYDQYGVYDTTNGVTESEIRTLAPHWPENSYFNIYVIIGFDGNKSSSGVMGWAGFPTNSDTSYDSFMKVKVVTNVNNSTLAHEFGHAMGLDHTFKGASSSPTNNPLLASDCPLNNNRTTDNDKVCDTEPGASLLNTYPIPTNSDVNPCTGSNYEGVQYNIMNYTSSKRKFTPGQKDRAISLLMLYRSSLTTSMGGKEIGSTITPNAITPPSCIPAGITNPGSYNAGPLNVTLGTINNSSSGYTNAKPFYYIDYTSQNCFNPSVYTDLQIGTPQTISVSFDSNSQRIKTWIDYNNNGTFESTEIVVDSGAFIATNNSPYSATFTPLSTAIINTYPRMRVRTDISNSGGVCDNLKYGQIEDYSVRIIDQTLNDPIQLSTRTNKILFDHKNNLLNLTTKQNEGFGQYEIYNINGKTIQRGYTDTKEILITNLLPRGMYFFKISKRNRKL